jgi:hypothetical protein
MTEQPKIIEETLVALGIPKKYNQLLKLVNVVCLSTPLIRTQAKVWQSSSTTIVISKAICQPR